MEGPELSKLKLKLLIVTKAKPNTPKTWCLVDQERGATKGFASNPSLSQKAQIGSLNQVQIEF